MVGQGSMHSTNSISSLLTFDALDIVMASLDPKTKLAYWRVWCRFRTFCKGHGLFLQLIISVLLLLNFNKPLSVRISSFNHCFHRICHSFYSQNIWLF